MNEFHYTQSMIHQIMHQDRCLHFPYYSFDHFLRLLQEAAISEEVTEIRISSTEWRRTPRSSRR